MTYDANGNQTSKTTTATSVPINYSYDAANRLVAASGGEIHSSFGYDGDGNRISQSTGAGTYSYLNDVATALPVVLQESGPDGNISYAYGLGLVSESSPTFDAFYQYNGLGSVVGLTDPIGKLLGRYGYDAWGQTDLSAPGPQLGTKNKFRFTGEVLDPETQLYYLRARYYDSGVGRLLTLDPFSSSKGLNRYVYSGNDPVNMKDLSGLSSTPASASAMFFSVGSNVLAANIGGVFPSTTRVSVTSLSGLPQTYIQPPAPITDDQRIQIRFQELLQQDKILQQCGGNVYCVNTRRQELYEQARIEILGGKYTAPNPQTVWGLIISYLSYLAGIGGTP